MHADVRTAAQELKNSHKPYKQTNYKKKVRANVRTVAQELKNSGKPYKRTNYKKQELLDGDAFSVLCTRPSMGNGFRWA